VLGRLTELYNYRELIRNLVIRDLKVRYKNSFLGVLWSLLNPLGMTLVFTIVFRIMLRSNTPNYGVFFMCGYLPWSFHMASLLGGTNSIVANAHLIKKVYFPREALPLAEVLSQLVNFFLGLLILFAMIFVTGSRLTPAVFLLPLIIFLQLLFTLGLAFFLAAANVFYRDVQHILQIVMQAWFFMTPVFYPITTLPESREILGMTVNIQLWMRRLNPMASLIATYRDVLYRGAPTGLDFFLRTAATCVVVFLAGYLLFCRLSPVFGEET
jgi:ABC-type polysaccharide/polyol phosphate export permease